ncbi:MAG: hypothetical protein LBN95_01150 [Prevotellaceae bacterium]|jgi:hypothetical protein|nr:hypothetical protein [Prevotellaceae bacterium]
MKKLTLFFGLLFTATTAFSQTWQTNSYGLSLNPTTQNLGIGIEPTSYMKLRLQNSAAYQGTLYGLYNYVTNSYAGSGSAYGIYSYSNTGTSSTGANYGLYSYTYSGNSASTATTYGLYSSAYKNGSTGTVYGLYSSVSGGAKRYAGYFTGGDVYVSGNVGIGVANPTVKLDISGQTKLYVPTSNTPVQALTLDVFSFVTDENSKNSYFIRCRDVDAGTNSEKFVIRGDGNVGIGIANPNVRLDVRGVIRAEEVRVCLNQGCDFVFDNNYNLMPLKDLKIFIDNNKHLPEVAPAAEMESEGINLSEMNAKLLQKVEELTLYIIELNQRIEKLETLK